MLRSAVVATLLIGAVAHAKANGIAASSCAGCHSGTPLQTATITAPTTALELNASVTVTITLGTGLGNGGVYVTSGGKGTLTPGPGMKSVTGGLVQSTPKAASGGVVTFTFTFTATNVPDGVDLDLNAVGGNGDNRSAGDRTAIARLSLVWGCSGLTYYADFDGDGHGNSIGGTTVRCGKPTGYALTNDDCDDNNELVFPGATEACNMRDDNCNSTVDEGLGGVATWPDVDGDGYGDFKGTSMTGCSAGKRAPNHDDCDDSDALAKPQAAERCNMKDDNCDGRIDENVRARCGQGWCARLAPTCDPTLCFPGEPTTEICDALDNDCDGQVDEGNLCPGGSCFEGQCIEGDPPLPGTGGGAQSGQGGGASGTGGGVEQGVACSSAGGLTVLLAVGALLRRRRSRQA